VDAYGEWCERNGCDHGHCPDGCSKPQPVLLADGRLVCGRCLIRFNEASEMVPCTPEVCGE
jgi:hypothetical protein